MMFFVEVGRTLRISSKLPWDLGTWHTNPSRGPILHHDSRLGHIHSNTWDPWDDRNQTWDQQKRTSKPASEATDEGPELRRVVTTSMVMEVQASLRVEEIKWSSKCLRWSNAEKCRKVGPRRTSKNHKKRRSLCLSKPFVECRAIWQPHGRPSKLRLERRLIGTMAWKQ